MSRVFLLNLDAEFELSGQTPSLRVRRQLEAAGQRAAAGLLRFGDRLLDGDATGMNGLAWCWTPSAVKALRDAGASVEHPPLAAVAEANHRAFAAELGQCLPGARFLQAPVAVSEVERCLRQGGTWRAKRAFGVAGRGQRRLSGEPTEKDLRWLGASHHGVQLEPELDLEGEFAIHGYLTAEGELRLGHPTQQKNLPGAWGQSERTGLPAELHRSLQAEAEVVAEALQRIGYWGPFNLDALRGRLGSEDVWVPRSEVNARYSMGWSTGMGEPAL